MTDYFARLNEPRRPWLEPKVLKARFLALSAQCHPDRVHSTEPAERAAATRNFAELNAAYQCLRVPKDRLLHLLTLELGRKPDEVHALPPATTELFLEVAQVCRETDDILAKQSGIASPLLRAASFERGLEWTERLNAVLQKVGRTHDRLLAELRTMNAAWDAAPVAGSSERQATLPLERLEQLYRALSYVSRWTAQIQERQTRLTL